MNDTKIDIKANTQEKNDAISCSKTRVLSVWEFAKDDPRRVIFAFKVGLAVLLVSLLILIEAPYEVFGNDIIWSLITVAIMFEYTVGMTFNRGFNRALGSLLACILAVCIAQVALLCGRVAQPCIVGVSIFIVGAITTFMKQWPSLVPYEYGFRVSLLSFCLIIVSGYKMGNPIRTAMDRMYSIAIGGIVAVLVNLLIFPMWAGEQLHKELVNHFHAVSDSLEECVRKYLKNDEPNNDEFIRNVLDEFPDEPAYKKLKDTLNSSSKLDGLANAAKWEPPHGKFNQMFYPWSEYVKVGAVLRYCAYEVMALHGVLHSEIQAPYHLRITFQSEITDTTNQASELLKTLGKDVSNMKRSSHSTLINKVHISAERLQNAISLQSHLMASKSSENNKRYGEMVRRKSKRLYSLPSGEEGAFEEDSGDFRVDLSLRMRMLESSWAFSVAMFSSLLVEFVARLDHLVDAVDELSRMAKFKEEGL